MPESDNAPRTRREARRRASAEVTSAPAGEPVTIEITVDTTPIPGARSDSSERPATPERPASTETPAGEEPVGESPILGPAGAEATRPRTRRQRRTELSPSAEHTEQPDAAAGSEDSARVAAGADRSEAPAERAEQSPRVGRRAAPSFSDGIERPASGRRAIVPVATTVIPVQEPAPTASAATPREQHRPRRDRARTPAASENASEAMVERAAGVAPAEPMAETPVIERPASGRRARIAVPTTVVPLLEIAGNAAPGAAEAPSTSRRDRAATGRDRAATGPDLAATPPARPATPPVPPKQVSRRTLRTSAELAAQLGDPSASGAAPEPRRGAGPADTAPDRAAEATGAGDADAQAPRSRGRRRRRGDLGRGAFSAMGLLLVAGIAVATSLPASAFDAANAMTTGEITSGEITSGEITTGQHTTGTMTTEALPAQQHTTSPGAAAAGVTRDGYTVRDIASLKAAGMRVADTFTNNPDGAIQWPFPVGVPISSYFGPRESPGGIGSTDHKGVDFTPGQGTTIQSIADGVVSTVVTSDNGGLGVYVIVDHVIDGEPVSSVYGHMLEGSVQVTEGQAVKVGQALGRVGNTGTSTGAHLHLEIRLGTTPTDPYAWLTSHTA
ncbi:peptidoglycan DD-metalloendopeptidase family protein [Herbiconiux liangxiaofengii]|uniref:peptidoglycan DD-metalloendopeptidase family protein n=1 Tax=Herbiconiux liangxiaofengii TaxID=3342795 RepID=UPI0035BBFE94